MSDIIGIASLSKQSPCAHVELDKEAVKKAKGFKPGQVIRLSLVGTVESLSMRKPDDPEEKGYQGSLSLEISSFDIGISQKNAYAELLDEDE